MDFFNNNVNKVIHGDCEETLKNFPDNCFDACICDPPFGIGFEYNEGKENFDSPELYGEWIKKVYSEIERVVKPGGFVAIFQSGKYFKYLWDWFGDDIFIYATCKDFLQIRSSMPINFGFDPIAIKYLPGADPLKPVKPKRNLNFYVARTSVAVRRTWDLRRGHPCPRPIDQMIELVDNFVVEGGVVLDCFCGAGTTLAACADKGRSFVGIEKNEEYATLSRRVSDMARDKKNIHVFGEIQDLF